MLVAKEELMKSEIIGPAEVRPVRCVWYPVRIHKPSAVSVLFHLTS